MLQVDCPGCKERLKFDEDKAGQVVACSHCGKRMKLPQRRTPARAPAPPPDDSPPESTDAPEEGAREEGVTEEADRPRSRRDQPRTADEGDEPEKSRTERRSVRKLGPVVARFPITQKSLLGRAVVGMLVCAGGLGILIWAIVGATDMKRVWEILTILFLFGGFGLAVIAGGAYLLLRVYQDGKNKVLLSRDGIAIYRRSRRWAYLWDDILSQRQCITEHYYNGNYTGTTHVYTLECVDGERHVLNDELRDVEKLGDAIAAEVTRREMPRVLADYDADLEVSFGKLGVSKEGLSYGESLLSWREIKGVRIHEGYISVSKKGGWFNWCKIAAADVPNLFVFLALVDEIIGVKGM